MRRHASSRFGERVYLLLDTLDQQAGNVVMLRRVSDEQIEVSHRAAEHVRGRGVCLLRHSQLKSGALRRIPYLSR